jgi:hypothetical protein
MDLPSGIFEVTFLGMTPCDFQKAKRNGGDCVMKAVSELMSQARPADKKHKTTSHRVVLVISSEGVRVVTQAGRTLEANIFVSNLCFTTEVPPPQKQTKKTKKKNKRKEMGVGG